MNMRTINSYIVFLSMMACASLNAQSLSVVQTRQFNLDALRTLENYEYCSSLYNNSARMEFDLLFQDRKMRIFNDLNGLSAAPTLSVADYSELLSSKGRSTQVIIKNLKKGVPYYDDGWKMDVSFDKEITYANACEILFSSKNFFGADFHIEMTLEWDEDMRSCTICRLEGKRGSDVEMLPQDYSILTHTSDRDFKVKADGELLSFNSFGQAFLSAKPKIAYPDQDVRVKPVIENADCNTISLLYTPKRFRIKPHYDLAIGDFYKGEGVVETESSASELGVDFGYILPSKGSLKLGVFFGLGLSQSTLDLKLQSLSYQYQAGPEADIDGDSYTRYYSIEGLSQTFKSSDVFVPVYLDMDFRMGNSFSLYLDAGVKSYLNLSNDLTIKSGTYSTYGYYPQYGIEMRPEDHWNGAAINGFVKNTSIASGRFNTEVNYKGFSVDIFGQGGLRYLLYQNLYLDLAVSYQMGLLSPFNSEAEFDLKAQVPSHDNALMYYSVKDGETIQSLTGGLYGMKRQGMKLNVGLMYRF